MGTINITNDGFINKFFRGSLESKLLIYGGLTWFKLQVHLG